MRGHLKQRSKGSWTLWIELNRDSATNERRRQTFTVRGTKKEAEAKLRELLHQLDTGSFVTPNKLTLGDLLKQWLNDYAAHKVRPRTLEGYQYIIERHLIPSSIGGIALTNLTPAHIHGYYSKALESGRLDGKGGLSARTVKHHHELLVGALNHAVKWGLVFRNIALVVDPPRPENKEILTLDDEAFDQMLEACRPTPYYHLFHLALHTGLRRSELLGLRWKNVDLDLATLSVVQGMNRLKDGSNDFREPKTAKGRRFIDLTPTSALALREHRQKMEAQAGLMGVPLTSESLVFTRVDGRPLSPSTVSHAFLDIARKAGLRGGPGESGIRLHDSRHTHATLMLKDGVHQKVVSERLGHSSVAFTLDTYGHVTPGMQKAAVLRFDQEREARRNARLVRNSESRAAIE